MPKAFINWVFMDEQFNTITGSMTGCDAVSTNNNVLKNHHQTISITRNGYLYVYCSNESDLDVFFDNLQLIQTHGPLIEETHYYPFGLSMEGISSQALKFGQPENNKLYNKGSELQHQEFGDGSGLELYSTQFRSLDPQLGRWWQIDPKPDMALSPYSAMSNNPLLHNDPLGDFARGTDEESAQRLLNLIINSFSSVKGSDALTELFTISDDKVTLSSIDKKAFKNALKNINSTDAKKLARGYFKLINNTKQVSFVSVTKKGEQVDLSKAVGMSDFLKGSVSMMDPKAGGGGRTLVDQKAQQSLSTIDLDNDKATSLGINKNGQPASYVKSSNEILAHELIGHAFSGLYYGNDTHTKENSIQVNNIYNRMVGNGIYDDGTSHNHPDNIPSSQGVPYPENIANGTPEYLNDDPE